MPFASFICFAKNAAFVFSFSGSEFATTSASSVDRKRVVLASDIKFEAHHPPQILQKRPVRSRLRYFPPILPANPSVRSRNLGLMNQPFFTGNLRPCDFLQYRRRCQAVQDFDFRSVISFVTQHPKLSLTI